MMRILKNYIEGLERIYRKLDDNYSLYKDFDES